MHDKSTIPYVYIYLLLDPDSFVPFYAGQTKDLKDASQRHRRRIGKTFSMEVIAVVAPDHADDEERFWIAALRECGYPLTNKTTGGQHSYIMAADVREKIGARFRGIPLSAEHRAKLSEARTGMILPPETRIRIGAAVRARWEDPESADRMRQGLIKGQQFHRTHQTEEARARISATLKGVSKSEETRARMKAAQQNRSPFSDEARAKMSASQKARFARGNHPLSSSSKSPDGS